MQLDISQNILGQFANRFGRPVNGMIRLRQKDGIGTISTTDFPNELELLQFQFRLHDAFSMSSYNPFGSDCFLLNINLSKAKIRKKVNGATVDMQRYLPTGMILYAPGIQVQSTTPAEDDFEVVLIRFNNAFLSTYFDRSSGPLQQLKETVCYEDIDTVSEELLKSAMKKDATLIKRHAALLEFLERFFKKLERRRKYGSYRPVHQDDLRGLFLAAARLRNPLAPSVPEIVELATIAGMSPTKFKVTFRQIFGAPPIRYFREIRMQYARAELISHRQTASEISYSLGYSHPSKFTSAFKKHFGVLPSSF